MISVSEALHLIKENTGPVKDIIEISAIESAGYVLSQDVISPVDLPAFDQSAMDGFAISPHSSERYHLRGEVRAGSSTQFQLDPGDAVRIFTGARVPESASAVVIQEEVVTDGDEICVKSDVSKGMNIRTQGEQLRTGSVALSKGMRVNPAAVGLLVSMGIEKVNVYRKPLTSVIVTGDELIAPGSVPEPGQIYESNSVVLVSALHENGFGVISVQHVKDEVSSITDAISAESKISDLILVSGGVSVGDHDHTVECLANNGYVKIFHGVDQKPGKPLYFGIKDDKIAFGLPGNPASALTCFYVYILPALRSVSGSGFNGKWIRAGLNSTFKKKGAREEFLRAEYSNGIVTLLPLQNSAMLHNYAKANALVRLPAGKASYESGDPVDVLLL